MKRGRSMSERDPVSSATPDTAVLADDAGHAKNSLNAEATAGAMLRDARQAQGLDVDSLAALLKVSAQKVQALERDRFDLLIDPAFVRALASSVCRILKIDPAPVLKRLPAISAFKNTSQNRGINTPFRSRETGPGSPLRMKFSRPAVLLGLALLLGALILIFLPALQQQIARYKPGGQSAARRSEVLEPVAGPAWQPASQPAATLNLASELGQSAAQASASQASAATAVAAAPLLQPSAQAGTSWEVAFSAKNESWVKVTDAKGVIVLSRTLHAGEQAGASGALPLAVAVGRADAIQVQVRGQTFDLKAIAKNNVARFEVK